MSNASRRHRSLDDAYATALAQDQRFREALARSGDRFHDVADPGGALLPSRRRMMDLKTMSEQRQTKVLFARLTECTSSRGTRYLRGHAGASNLVAFRGEDDEQGRPTWQLFLAERIARPEAKQDHAPAGELR